VPDRIFSPQVAVCELLLREYFLAVATIFSHLKGKNGSKTRSFRMPGSLHFQSLYLRDFIVLLFPLRVATRMRERALVFASRTNANVSPEVERRIKVSVLARGRLQREFV